jgi:hypothetical protein
VGQKLLQDHPSLFELVRDGAKVEALSAPESDKQTKAPPRRKG